MGNLLKFKGYLCLLLLLIGLTVQAQKEHVITLYVNTTEVNMRNMETTCNFGQETGVSNEDFTVYVEKGDTIIWNAVSTSSDQDKVEVRSIRYSSGTNFFDSERLRDSNGVVTGIIENGEPGDYEKYDLYFKVYRNGRAVSGEFPIDPKIRMTTVGVRE